MRDVQFFSEKHKILSLSESEVALFDSRPFLGGCRMRESNSFFSEFPHLILSKSDEKKYSGHQLSQLSLIAALSTIFR
jgi:hypothetical protein